MLEEIDEDLGDTAPINCGGQRPSMEVAQRSDLVRVQFAAQQRRLVIFQESADRARAFGKHLRNAI